MLKSEFKGLQSRKLEGCIWLSSFTCYDKLDLVWKICSQTYVENTDTTAILKIAHKLVSYSTHIISFILLNFYYTTKAKQLNLNARALGLSIS